MRRTLSYDGCCVSGHMGVVRMQSRDESITAAVDKLQCKTVFVFCIKAQGFMSTHPAALIHTSVYASLHRWRPAHKVRLRRCDSPNFTALLAVNKS